MLNSGFVFALIKDIIGSSFSLELAFEWPLEYWADADDPLEIIAGSFRKLGSVFR